MKLTTTSALLSNIELIPYPDLDHGLTARNGERKTAEVISRIVWKAAFSPTEAL